MMLVYCQSYTYTELRKQSMPIAQWADERDDYLDALMELEGRGRFQGECASCGEAQPAYHCKDCTHGALWCKGCIVLKHRLNPLHIVEVCSVIVT